MQISEPQMPSAHSLDDLAWVCKALSDPARLKIIMHLAKQQSGLCCGVDLGICACDFEGLTGLSQPTISHHMKCLVSAQLVGAEKRGKWTYYRINPAGFRLLKTRLGLLME